MTETKTKTESETVERLPRWRGATLLALAVLAAALATQSAALAVAALVPVAFVGYARLSRSTDRTIRVERSVSPATPAPGEHVTVELAVSTPDGTPIGDLRIVDGVPDALAVMEGSPRAHLALTGDGVATISYDVIAKRGDFNFETPTAEIRPVSGALVRSPTVVVEGAETVSCQLLLEELPLRDRTIHFVGQVQTDVGGSGVEFYSTREYRPGDPLSRIDWRRYARGGGLTTVEFREEQATPVVFVVDARPETQVARGHGFPTAFDLCQYGAERGTVALVNDGNAVGLSLFGGGEWVEPGGTAATRNEVSAALDIASRRAADGGVSATVDEHESTEEDGDSATKENVAEFDVESTIRRLRQRLPAGAQVVFWTPVLDEVPVTAVRRLESSRVPVTVISPDVATGETPGKRITALERESRLHELRAAGAHVVDWDADEPVALAIGRAIEGGAWP